MLMEVGEETPGPQTINSGCETVLEMVITSFICLRKLF